MLECCVGVVLILVLFDVECFLVEGDVFVGVVVVDVVVMLDEVKEGCL